MSLVRLSTTIKELFTFGSLNIQGFIINLHVFISDPRPAFQLLNYTVSVQENGPPVQLVLNISVRAGSKDKTHAKMVFKIISGSHTFVNIVHQ